jgi:LysM repeat protein
MKFFQYVMVLFTLIILSACVPSGQLALPNSAFTEVPPTKTIAPTLTPTVTNTPAPLLSPTPLPSPTSTPRIHSVKLGETLGGIAWIYGVSVDTLMEMNPEIDPYVLTVDMQVVIPVETLPPANQTPEPTPIQIPLEGLNCLADETGGVWCFVWVQNTGSEAYENVNVSFNLADMEASEVTSRQGTAPLNVLLAGEKLPVAVYFPEPNPEPFQKSAQFLSAIPYNPTSNRYIPIQINVGTVTSLLNDQMLTIAGDFSMEEQASQISIVAVALDEQDQIIGMRRWQAATTDPVSQGDFTIDLAAVSGKIADYQLFIEAQPSDLPD